MNLLNYEYRLLHLLLSNVVRMMEQGILKEILERWRMWYIINTVQGHGGPNGS